MVVLIEVFVYFFRVIDEIEYMEVFFIGMVEYGMIWIEGGYFLYYVKLYFV